MIFVLRLNQKFIGYLGVNIEFNTEEIVPVVIFFLGMLNCLKLFENRIKFMIIDIYTTHNI